jgi:hypothetical protein
MAFGGSPAIGLIAYTTVKLVGYSFFGRKLNQWYNKAAPRPFVFGAVRTLLGVIVGVSSLFMLSNLTSNQGALFFIFLIPIRFCEWFLILYLFYERKNYSFKRISGYSALGIICSFLLDIPAIISVFVIPGGVWVC